MNQKRGDGRVLGWTSKWACLLICFVFYLECGPIMTFLGGNQMVLNVYDENDFRNVIFELKSYFELLIYDPYYYF